MGKSPFLERVRLQIRLRHYSIRTEQSYLHWVYRFIIFKKRHPHDMAEAEVSAFLGWLVVERQVRLPSFFNDRSRQLPAV
jgi:hypothetical protein